MARPTKGTPELTTAIAADIAQGVPGEVAAVARGIGRSTFYNWVKWGRQREPGFVEFRDAIKRARAEAESHYVGIIRAATLKNWQAAAWWLERRAPGRWGRWGPSPAPEKPRKSDKYKDMTEQELLEKLKIAVIEVGESIAQKLLAAGALLFRGFNLNSVDNVNNADTDTVTFSIIVTAQSIKDEVKYFRSIGAITQDEATSLLQKLNAAAAYRARSDCKDANITYKAFINELRAQTGKKVTAQAAATLIADAQYLIAHCP